MIDQWLDENGWRDQVPATALLVLADGTVIEGQGAGHVGETAGELCFNTALTGYQEILSDPSYARQIVTFTFPHIGNVGVNDEDLERSHKGARGAVGCVLNQPITAPSNWRASKNLDDWLKARRIIAITSVDTRALTHKVRQGGLINAMIAHDPEGKFDRERLIKAAAELPPMLGQDLVPGVTVAQNEIWNKGLWRWNQPMTEGQGKFHVAAIDFGMKTNILRNLAARDCRVTVVPASTSAEAILALKPDGVFLSNGPGDPDATGEIVMPHLRELAASGLPIFGICLGHQLLGLALGAKTVKMHQGHHGANHPVLDIKTGRVEITSMNHGFAIDKTSLPEGVKETHRSLFDGTNGGLEVEGKPIFSVQYHPEASPGPEDSHHLFDRFVALMEAHSASLAEQ